MYEAMYLEINIICVLVLIFIFYRGIGGTDKKSDKVALNQVVLVAIAIHIIDCIWVHLDGKQFVAGRALNYTVNVCYMFFAAYISYLWLMFTTDKFDKRLSKKHKLLIGIPLIMYGIICLVTTKTGWLFTVDEFNRYHRGSLYIIQVIVSYGYFLAAEMYSLKKAYESKRRFERTEALIVMSFAIFPLVGGVISTIVYGLPVLWPCVTISLVMIYIDLQAHQISTDGLTGLNNRRQFDVYLAAEESEDKVMYLIMGDIDEFKTINDTYGHAEGDRALIKTAEILKKVGGEHNVFIARYGGDEFAIVCKKSSEDEVKSIMSELDKEFENYSASGESEYEIKLSMGYGAYTYRKNSEIRDIIIDADKKLYEAKHKNTQS